MDKKICTLVILNYNDADSTVMCVSHALSIDQINHIVIVDNHSIDDSIDVLEKITDKRVHLIKAHKNSGYAYGNNLGCRYAIDELKSDCVFIANPDTEFDKNVVRRILDVYSNHKDAAIVSAIMNTLSGIKLASAWKLPTYKNCLQECFIGLDRIHKRGNQYTDVYLRSASVIPVDVINGAFFCISRVAYEKAGGFDERTFLYYEENIIASRLKKVGLQSYLVTDFQYDHEHQKSINKNLKGITEKFQILEQSREIYCREYLLCNDFQVIMLKLIYVMGLALYVIFKRLKGICNEAIFDK